jgi:hypothetical protein
MNFTASHDRWQRDSQRQAAIKYLVLLVFKASVDVTDVVMHAGTSSHRRHVYRLVYDARFAPVLIRCLQKWIHGKHNGGDRPVW